ncbi:MAG TPA: hypothetical protein VK934_00970 [Fimbriimonas sp.]|nr:hypothetical protein [Fimbriimonas sp.]
MRNISVLALGAFLCATAVSQSNLERTPLPSLPGSSNTVLKKSVAGPSGTVYSLLAGQSAGNSQILRVVKQTPGLAPFEFPIIDTMVDGSDVKATADLAVDSTGSAYVMFTSSQIPGQDRDAAVTKFAVDGTFKWTRTINEFWRDDDWVLHPFVDVARSLAYDSASSALYLLSVRSKTNASTKSAVVTRITGTGTVSWTQPYSRNGNMTDPVKIIVASNLNPIAIMNTVDDAEEDNTGGDLTTVAFNASSGFVMWQDHFTAPNSVFEVAADITRGSDQSVFVSGLAEFNDTRSGLPYPYTGEIVIKFSEFGGRFGSRVATESDHWDRKGQVGWPFLAGDNKGGVYVAGSFNAYADPQPPFNISVRYYDSAFNEPMVRFVGPLGGTTAVGSDKYGNVYVSGFRTTTNSGGTTVNRVFGLKLSKSLNVDTNVQFMRQVWFRVDSFGSADQALSEPPYGASVIPVNAGDPWFGVTEKVKVNGVYYSAAATLKSLDEPEVLSVNLDKPSVFGGFKRVATVTLDRFVSATLYPDGMPATILSSNPDVVPTRKFTFPVGKKTAQVLLDTASVQADTTVTLRMSPNYLVSNNLVVQPFSVTLTTEETEYDGGDGFDLKIVLSQAAPPEGMTIQLKSSSSALPLPNNGLVAFASGQKEKTISLLSNAVYSTVSVTISGPPSFTSSVTITLKPLAVVLTTSKRTFFAFESGNVTATLTKPAPKGGYTISLKSSNQPVLALPKSMKIAEGKLKTATSFSVAEVSARVDVTISGGPGLAATTVVTIQPQCVKTITLAETSVQGGTKQIKGTVTLSGPAPSQGAQVTLTSTTASIEVPDTVDIAAGATSADFMLDTNPVSAEVTGYVRATFNSTASAKLIVTPVMISGFTIAPTVVGGERLAGSLTLDGPAPTGGLAVQITSDRAAVDSPRLTVPAGATSLDFSVSTLPVDVDTIATLAAQAGSVKLTAQTTVKAPTVESVLVDPSTLTSGAYGKLTVNLTSPAPAGGVVVKLSSTSSALSVPGSVLVPGGSKTASVQVKAGTVTSSTSATAKATLGVSVASFIVTVNP